MRCIARNKDGSPCKSNALAGSEYCFTHDPDSASKRHEARSKGGKTRILPNKTLPEDIPPVEITDSQSIVKLISDTINQVRTGQLNVKIGNAIGYLSGIALKAIEQSDFETRINELENIMKKGSQSNGVKE